MKVSPEFKKELLKAMRLSVFLTVLVFGMLMFGGAGRVFDDEIPARSIATDSRERNGIRESSSRRAIPPFVRSNQ